MYVCIYVCMYVCMYVCIYIYIYIHTYIHIHIHSDSEPSGMYSTAAASKDRAVQIIALPAVFGCTAMNAALPPGVLGSGSLGCGLGVYLRLMI